MQVIEGFLLPKVIYSKSPFWQNLPNLARQLLEWRLLLLCREIIFECRQDYAIGAALSCCFTYFDRIYKLEKNLKTPLKFLFPNYETTNWYAARSILKKMKGEINISPFSRKKTTFFLSVLILKVVLWYILGKSNNEQFSVAINKHIFTSNLAKSQHLALYCYQYSAMYC